jgi:acyl-coenzyme A thioesterase PaaI-like protein
MCFACGRENPIGLHLEFHPDGDRATRARFVPAKAHQGYADIVHGGILALAMDEAMVRLLYTMGYPAVSGTLHVRLEKTARVGEPLLVRGEFVEARSRALVTRAEVVRESDGERLARADAICVRLEPPDPRGTGQGPGSGDGRDSTRGKTAGGITAGGKPAGGESA